MRYARFMTMMTSFALVTGLAAPVTAATPKPKITFKMAASATAVRGLFTYSYTDAYIPTGGKLALQRFMGTPKRWTTVKFLHGKSGHSAVRPSAIGVYSFRLVVLDRHGKALVAVRRNSKAYANIPISGICSAPNIYTEDRDWVTCAPDAGTSIVGASQFPWVLDIGAPLRDPQRTETQGARQAYLVTGTTCRSLHLVMGVSDAQLVSVGGTAKIHVLVSRDEGGDDVTATFAGGALTTMNVTVHPGTDYWVTAVSDFQGEGSLDILTNGTMSCYTKTGA
ncbi:MAG: hypothetical protein QOJ11_2641 [Frankiales bacterium]|jgi:hypothetical protein|nr:hypothetical protein [Frankiales bacterium]